jgi:hypothetical protein
MRLRGLLVAFLFVAGRSGGGHATPPLHGLSGRAVTAESATAVARALRPV